MLTRRLASMMTRRQVFELTAGAWLAAMLGCARPARAAGMNAMSPGYLRRASWLPLSGATVDVADVTLRLHEVTDLPYLAGRDDAFALEFTGAAGTLTGGIQPFRHTTLGTFELFISPVDTVVAGTQRYEVVIERSVGVPESTPTGPSTTSGSAPTSHASRSASAATSATPRQRTPAPPA